MANPILIFLAGSGTRLRPYLKEPVAHKSLVPLDDGTTITSRMIGQIHQLREEGLISDIHVVLGNAAEAMEEYIRAMEPKLIVHMNNEFATTNTAASARYGLNEMTEDTVLCMDGDVVLDIDILRQCAASADHNVIVSKPAEGPCEDEAVKAKYDEETGQIAAMGKGVPGQAEAVGIYKIPRPAVAELLNGDGLANKYFDDVLSIYAEAGHRLVALDIGRLPVTEVDDLGDWNRAREIVKETKKE